MSFIGIISDEKTENFICQKLQKELHLSDSSVLYIKEQSIENIRNIKFETILLAREFKKVDILKSILKDAKYLIVNSDIEANLNILDNLEVKVVTYGFNSKATITASSVTDEDMLICVQRSIEDINGKEIEPQEISVGKAGTDEITKLKQSDEKKFNTETLKDTNSIMAIIAILLIYGKNNL